MTRSPSLSVFQCGLFSFRFLDSYSFATCSDDCMVNLWDIRNLKAHARQFRGHTKWVKNIEYASEKRALVTSGFDGSIFRWNLDTFASNGVESHQKLLNFSGLMRMRLSALGDKMAISTMNGYLIIIHDLDLDTFYEDLKLFKPNMYRLLQLSEKPLGNSWSYTKHFHAKRNRVEFIDDFPSGNQADMISSLKIHPQGWVAATRNISSNEESEVG